MNSSLPCVYLSRCLTQRSVLLSKSDLERNPYFVTYDFPCGESHDSFVYPPTFIRRNGLPEDESLLRNQRIVRSYEEALSDGRVLCIRPWKENYFLPDITETSIHKRNGQAVARWLNTLLLRSGIIVPGVGACVEVWQHNHVFDDNESVFAFLGDTGFLQYMNVYQAHFPEATG